MSTRPDELQQQLGCAIWEARLAQARERVAILERVQAEAERCGSFAEAAKRVAPDVSAASVARWKKRWRAEGLEGLVDRRVGPPERPTNGRAGTPEKARTAARGQLLLAGVMDRSPRAPGAPAARRRGGRGAVAHPLVKWPGGKAAVVPFLLPRVPRTFAAYHEPFVGGGALFFALRARGGLGAVHLSDANAELVNLYCVVRDALEPLLEALATYRNTRENYLAVRGTHPDSLAPVERAARTLFLNRTCFNGLYRVNRQGLFNVPYGSQSDSAFFQPEALRGAHKALAGVSITCADFASAVEHVEPRDFVYLDPPYVSGLRAGAGFASYQAGGFDEQDQRRLAAIVRSLGERGAFVMVSNSEGDLPRELYDGFHVETLSVRRQVGGHKGRRGHAAEILVCNYSPE